MHCCYCCLNNFSLSRLFFVVFFFVCGYGLFVSGFWLLFGVFCGVCVFFGWCFVVVFWLFVFPSRRTDARKHALEVERQRAAKVASLPPPPPHPLEVCIHDGDSDHNFRVPCHVMIYWYDCSQQDIQNGCLHPIRRVVQQK